MIKTLTRLRKRRSAGFALLLAIALAFPPVARATPLPNGIAPPVMSNVGWIAAPIAVALDSFSFEAGNHYPQLTGSVNVTATTDNPSIAVASAADGTVRVQVKSTGTTRLAITGTEASSSALTDHLQMKVTLLGDTDGDGVLTSADVLYINKVVNSKLTTTDEEKNRLDINRDGQITSADAILLMNSYVGKTPVTGGVKFLVSLSDVNDAPVAEQAAISGTIQTGQALTGTYRYLDPENDAESNSAYQWYRGSQADGIGKTTIAGATGNQYTVQDADVGQYLFFAVTPVDAKGAAGSAVVAATGSLVLDTTPPVLASTIPAAGAAKVDLNASLSATFSEPVEAADGKSIIVRRSADNVAVRTYAANDTTNVTISGRTVVFLNPGLDGETSYYVEIDAGAFLDLAGNEFAGLNLESSWSFMTKDVAAPVAISTTPVNQGMTVDKTADFSLTFNKPVVAVAGKWLSIRDKADDSVKASYEANDNSKVIVAGTTVTIQNPGLDEKSSYYIEIESGAFEDVSGNSFAGLSGNAAWTFTVPDLTAPTVDSTTPDNGGTGVNRSDDLTVTFSKPVVAVAGKTILIRRATDNSILKTYAANDANEVVISGATVTLKSPNLEDGASFYVEIDAGAFKDAAGNDFAGLNGSTGWSFATEDTIAPFVSSTTPANNATGVSKTADLSVTFNEPVIAVNGKAVTIRDASDNSAFATYTLGTDSEVTVSGGVLTIQHSAFAELQRYYVEIESGALKDAAGNGFAGMTGGAAWSFESLDSRVLSATPGVPLVESNLGTGAYLILDITGDTFSSDIKEQDFRLNHAPQGLEIDLVGTMNPNTAFVLFDFDGTDFDTSITDFSVTALPSALTSGKTLTSNTMTITAEAKPTPNITGTTPANNAVDVGDAANLTLVFDKNVTAAAGKAITIYKKANDSVFETIMANDTTKVSVSGGTVTIQHNPFVGNLEYYVLVDAGAFTANDAGNAAITDKTVWNFKIAAPAPDMFISEFLRGSGSHQVAIELYYPTAASPNPAPADTYSLFVYQYNTATSKMVVAEINIGSGHPIFRTVPYIIIDRAFDDFMDVTKPADFSSTGYPYVNNADVFYDYPANVYLKALVLKKGSQVVDVVGDPNATGPGSFLASGGTLVRKSGIAGGSKIYEPLQWDVYPVNTFNKIGNHTP
ncbi:hypothetical protein D7Z26_24675 [Cohnella endophytica]|uniref:Dockerin domain-containing protein n=1 Tax=Cohnella endophytica TaxID=2419778 RepID=A0A494XDP4_9BACL|nr:Ig-like domain-containing protein [Cohnella endophytica]RKP46279.1 hypothetical protein D7Z26_24675 [Cohnella endophytica]